MNISPAIQKTFGRSVLQVQKYSPQILAVAGIAGVVTAAVLAAKNTLKLEATLDVAETRLEAARETGDQKVVNKAYFKNATDVAKLYAAPVTLGVVSIACIIGGQGILQKRNVGLALAYKGLEQSYNSFRERVIEEYGPEKAEELRTGVREVTETNKDGKKIKKTVVDDRDRGDYIYEFGVTNDNWSSRKDHNEFYLETAQRMLNDKLATQGHLFLNDVLRTLGFPDTKVGAVTGWVLDNLDGDGAVDFRVKDLVDSHGYYLLDFNVDGVILDLI